MQPLECEPSGAELLRPTPAAKTSARSYSLKGPLAAVVLVAAVVSLIVVVVTSDGSPTAENLLEAVQSRDVPLVERLLAKGAPVNELVRDAHYRRITALYAAVFDRNIEMATVLVKHGADVFRSTQYGKGPSKIAFDADMQALLAAQGKKQAAFVAAVVACPRTTCKIQELLTGGADAGWTDREVLDEKGEQSLIEIKREFLLDYLAARNLSLRLSYYRQRVENVPALETSEYAGLEGHQEERDDGRFELLIRSINDVFGGSWAMFRAWRTDVDEEDDAPVMGPESNENTDQRKKKNNCREKEKKKKKR